jgi:hypothetical protein
MDVGVCDVRGVACIPVDLGFAQGWNVSELETGEWAWNAWGRARSESGIEASESEAQEAAQRALEEIAAEERAAAQGWRELPVGSDRRMPWDPQSC